jgi:hypothetical protein
MNRLPVWLNAYTKEIAMSESVRSTAVEAGSRLPGGPLIEHAWPSRRSPKPTFPALTPDPGYLEGQGQSDADEHIRIPDRPRQDDHPIDSELP